MSVVSTSGNTPKSMSTRLLTMKFMQRASGSPLSSVSDQTEPMSKRQKREKRQPSRQETEMLDDRKAFLEATVQEEEKKQAALDKLAAAYGDTRWVLNDAGQTHPVPIASVRFVHTGYASLDVLPPENYAADKSGEWPATFGRRSFGRFNKALEKSQNPLFEDSEVESETKNKDDQQSTDSENTNSDDEDPTSQLIRATQREMKKNTVNKPTKRSSRANSVQSTKKRRKEEVNLNKLTSLSGRQEITPKSQIECFSCGGPHRKSECPRRKRPFTESSEEFSRKVSKLQ
ncbi:BgTH12-00956 [Blumeria graminis f. sp. triticale]|uniref:BgTH12-00956 n=1 Tax=Blumeria graminis f. sp. triticale TaxID=1689686 RepID=A0A9W4D5Z8_BLUGR|nr:BgTH12-00956 [Blumeria graminis f. sp. triticale]